MTPERAHDIALQIVGPFGLVEASINPIAASLRSLTVGGRALVQTYLGDPPPLQAGAVMVPWPNRIDRGEWVLNGETMRLDINEPALDNAIHGLLQESAYRVETQHEASAALAARIDPVPGYPFTLDTEVHYQLTERGVGVTHRIRNGSDCAAPVALGAHPYLRCGRWDVHELHLQLPADTALLLDVRHLPNGSMPVAGTAFDLNEKTPVPDAVPHASYTDLMTVDGQREFSLHAPDGRRTVLRAEERFRWAQVYIVPDFPGPYGAVNAIALEPMTAPPNSLADGTDLKWIAPGDVWELRWGIETT
jgi:aldose 1-epimerase